jgi:hypothetical protein
MTDSVRHLFPQLLANGYTPLPNRDKVCMLKGWPIVEVDEAKCKRWSRQSRWPAIGLRADPPLLVFDNDLPRADVAAAVRAVLPRSVLGGLERIGNPPKTAFFLRMSTEDEPFRELHTRRYYIEGEPKVTYAVQAFGGGPGAQLGAFGPHSHDDKGNVIRTYHWVNDRSPANVRIDDLPEMTREQVNAALMAAEDVLVNFPGMHVDTLAAAAGGGFQPVHDLNDQTIFHDVDGSAYTLQELTEEARNRVMLRQPQLRLTGSFTNDPRSTGSPRAKVSWSPRTGLAVIDFKTGLTHRPMLLEDPETQEMLKLIFTKKVP